MILYTNLILPTKVQAIYVRAKAPFTSLQFTYLVLETVNVLKTTWVSSTLKTTEFKLESFTSMENSLKCFCTSVQESKE